MGIFNQRMAFAAAMRGIAIGLLLCIAASAVEVSKLTEVDGVVSNPAGQKSVLDLAPPIAIPPELKESITTQQATGRRGGARITARRQNMFSMASANRAGNDEEDESTDMALGEGAGRRGGSWYSFAGFFAKTSANRAGNDEDEDLLGAASEEMGWQSGQETTGKDKSSDCVLWVKSYTCTTRFSFPTGEVESLQDHCPISCGHRPKCNDKTLSSAPWKDSAGDGCSAYGNQGWCATYGNGYANQGLTANLACCGCGGGSSATTIPPSEAPTTAAPSDAPITAAPTDPPSEAPTTAAPSEAPIAAAPSGDAASEAPKNAAASPSATSNSAPNPVCSSSSSAKLVADSKVYEGAWKFVGKSNDMTTSCENDGWRFYVTKFPSERVYIQNSAKCWKDGNIGKSSPNGGFWRKVNGKWQHTDSDIDNTCGVQKIRHNSGNGMISQNEKCWHLKSQADPNSIYIKMTRHAGCKGGGPLQPPSPKNQSLCASSSCHEPSMDCVTRHEEQKLQPEGYLTKKHMIFKAGKAGDCFDKCSLPRNVLYHDPEYYCNALLAMGCPYDCKKCIGAVDAVQGWKIKTLPSKSQLTQHKILCDTQENLDRLKPVEDPNCKDVYNDCSTNLHFCTNVNQVKNCKKTCDKCN